MFMKRPSSRGEPRRTLHPALSHLRLAAWSAATAAGVVGIAPAQAQGLAPSPTSVTLPADEAPHHNLLEWWYFVGHLSGVDPAGKTHQYGYEVTVFQLNVGVGPANYSAHFAITDITTGKYSYEERAIEAPIPNETDGFALSVGNWSVLGSSGNYAVGATFSDNTYGLQLSLSSAIPPALNGTDGIIPYGGWGTSAYYSYTSLATSGTIIDHGIPVKVTGVSWQDRQWFDPTGTSGWNWFAIQLKNNVQYMLYYLQDSTGAIIQTVGTEVVNGVAVPVPAGQMTLQPLSYWVSPKTLYTYPSKWRITVPDGSFTVTPVIQDQELAAPLHHVYFEGDSTVVGNWRGLRITGDAYAEVNPYYEPYLSLP